MAAEYLANALQSVNPNAPIIFTASIPCTKGYVYHEDETGIFILRGIVNNPCASFATYQVTFNGNIAATGTPEAIAVAIAVNGEPRQTSTAIYSPAAVDDFGNVTSTAIIKVPRGCCFSLSIESVPVATDPATAPVIDVQNANLVINRIA